MNIVTSLQRRYLLQQAAIPSLVFFLSALVMWPMVAIGQSDVKLYYRYANAIFQGATPYHTLPIEYPPLALIPILLPRMFSFGFSMSITVYWFLLLCENTLWFYLMVLISCRLARSLGHAVGPFLFRMSVVGAVSALVLPWRFDLFPALLTSVMLLSLVPGRILLAGGWLGAGIATKLYPAVFGPVAAVWLLAQRRWADVLRLASAAAAVLLLVVLPFWWIDADALLAMFRYHSARGVQIESVASGIIMVAKLLGMTTVDVQYNYGAYHMASPWAAAILPWLMPIFIGLYTLFLGFVFWMECRLQRIVSSDRSAVFIRQFQCFLVAVLLFIITNKVFSLQYIAWMMPFIVILSRRQFIYLFVIVLFSVLIYPFTYGYLQRAEFLGIAVLNIRNIATLLLLVDVFLDILKRYRGQMVW